MSDLYFPPMTPLEIQRIFTLLGIRFWDPSLDKAVTQDLEVTGWFEGKPQRKMTAFRTASGVYAFRGLPEMRNLEYPSDENTPWDADVVPARFIYTVKDLRRRYLPLAYAVEVPFRGVYPEELASSPVDGATPSVWLFYAPTRSARPDLAILRAEIRIADLASPSQPSADTPASYARVEIEVEEDTWYGVAGEDGQVAVIFPYPDFASPVGFSSPVRAMPPQTWPLIVRVFFEPDVQQFPEGATVPNARSLFDQGLASIWVNEDGDTLDELHLEFSFGERLVLHTGEEFTLWITPA